MTEVLVMQVLAMLSGDLKALIWIAVVFGATALLAIGGLIFVHGDDVRFRSAKHYRGKEAKQRGMRESSERVDG